MAQADGVGTAVPLATRNALEGAIKHSVRLAQRSYRVAVPQYYRGRIQLLLPLYLREFVESLTWPLPWRSTASGIELRRSSIPTGRIDTPDCSQGRIASGSEDSGRT